MTEAERLADALEQGTYLLSQERDATAAELRRLHAINAELVEALEKISSFSMSQFSNSQSLASECIKVAYYALEKAKQ